MSVFVLDQRKRPLMPCSERRARLLLAQTSGRPSGVAVHDPTQRSKARGKPTAASRLEA